MFGELIRIAFVFGEIACFRLSVLIVKLGFVFTMTAFAFRKLHRSGYITKYGSNTISSSFSSRIAEYDRNIPPVTPDEINTSSANLCGEYFSRIFSFSSVIPAVWVYPVLSSCIALIKSSLTCCGTLKSGCPIPKLIAFFSFAALWNSSRIFDECISSILFVMLFTNYFFFYSVSIFNNCFEYFFD